MLKIVSSINSQITLSKPIHLAATVVHMNIKPKKVVCDYGYANFTTDEVNTVLRELIKREKVSIP